jgi:D-alanyl-D-alanine carboxypeptidase (penicillin-binding protein 5/6)
MNKKALELNMRNSHFSTPNGLDNDNHYSTAYDMALLTNYALNNDTFCKIVGTKTTNISWKNSYKTISNTNELLGNYPGVYGVKTGFTFNAGRCLISACKQNNLDFIVVVLGANTKKDRTLDSIKILNYVNSLYKMIDLTSSIKSSFETSKSYYLNNFTVNGTNNYPEISINLPDENIFPIKETDISLISFKTYMFSTFSAPMVENTKIGILYVYQNTTIIAEYDIVLENNLEKRNFKEYFIYVIKKYLAFDI